LANAEFLNVQTGGVGSYHWALNCNMNCNVAGHSRGF